jgi:hypothetical protein
MPDLTHSVHIFPKMIEKLGLLGDPPLIADIVGTYIVERAVFQGPRALRHSRAHGDNSPAGEAQHTRVRVRRLAEPLAVILLSRWILDRVFPDLALNARRKDGAESSGPAIPKKLPKICWIGS